MYFITSINKKLTCKSTSTVHRPPSKYMYHIHLWMHTRSTKRPLGCSWVRWWTNGFTSGRTWFWICSLWKWRRMSFHPGWWWCHTTFFGRLANLGTLTRELDSVKPCCLLVGMVCGQFHDITINCKISIQDMIKYVWCNPGKSLN